MGELTQQQTAARKHGMHAVEYRGEEALTPPQLTRLAELKLQLNSEPGRVEYRRDLTSFIAEMVEMGFSRLRLDVEQGKDIWNGPGPMARLAVYVNTLTRLLDNWPKEGGGGIAPRQVLDAIAKAGRLAQEEHTQAPQEGGNDGSPA